MARLAKIIASGAALASPAAVYAQEDPAADTVPEFDVTVTITGVSDYRFRGISLSDTDPAVQASVEVEHESGFYVGTWGSTIKNSPADVELDLYGGWRGSIGSVDLDVGAVAYVYPGAPDLDYVELLSNVSYSLGPADVKLGVAYAAKQANIGSDDNFYAYADASVGIPETPVTVTAHVGYENGPLAGLTGKKWDWSLGAEVVVDRFTLGLSYVDTNVDRLRDPGKLAGAGIVASIKIEF